MRSIDSAQKNWKKTESDDVGFCQRMARLNLISTLDVIMTPSTHFTFADVEAASVSLSVVCICGETTDDKVVDQRVISPEDVADTNEC
jgi:hypothetical protein